MTQRTNDEPMNTLPIDARDRRAHDVELLGRIRSYQRAVSLAELFEGATPLWAAEAAERLVSAGMACEDDAGRLTARG
jgi:hypothetical protein